MRIRVPDSNCVEAISRHVLIALQRRLGKGTHHILALLVVAVATASAQSDRMSRSPDLVTFLNFERDHRGGSPSGWGGGPANSPFVDNLIVHSGKWAARIERTATSKGAVASLASSLPIDFVGQRVELRGFLRTQNVAGFAGLWLMERRGGEVLNSENMRSQQLQGTTDWREYSVVLPLRPDATTIHFGVSISGTGKAWADDLQLLIDGTPIWQAPKSKREPTGLDHDREFDDGSKIALRDVTPLQIDNLATLGRVWGFLKYHHPKITSGQLHWDYELFRVLPAVLAAVDRAAANETLAHWISGLGELKPGTNPKLPETDVHLRPDIGWIGDEARLGTRLSKQLRAIHAARPEGGSQFYVSLAPIVVGSTTAGADGNASRFQLPGGHHTMISGIGVFYPDKRPTQRIGIVPDIEAHPTLAGIRAGRDEVLEVALRQILGHEISDDEIRRLIPILE